MNTKCTFGCTWNKICYLTFRKSCMYALLRYQILNWFTIRCWSLRGVSIKHFQSLVVSWTSIAKKENVEPQMHAFYGNVSPVSLDGFPVYTQTNINWIVAEYQLNIGEGTWLEVSYHNCWSDHALAACLRCTTTGPQGSTSVPSFDMIQWIAQQLSRARGDL